MNFIELSKEVSYALRHAPWEYDLEMDEEGWVPVEQLLNALHGTEKWKKLEESDLSNMIKKSEKKRHELKDGKIRSYYGHSTEMKILKKEQIPPNILYHGTARRFLESIRKNGLLPQNRQFVHLSKDLETAKSIGKRHDSKPCILIVDAKMARNDGINFYLGNENVWLADAISAKYLKEL